MILDITSMTTTMAHSIITQVSKEDDEDVASLEQFTPHSDHARQPAAISVRKPRARRFISNLLCCFGAKNPELHLPPQADLVPSDHYSPKPLEKLLLPPIRACDINKKCLIIDLDETLVHSSFKPVKNPDFIIPVEIDGIVHQVYVLKRPYVDEFLQRIGDVFECILFTASLAKYADPVADLLDRWGVFRARLFREACVFHKGNYVKDLNRLGRDLKRVIIVDNSPASFAFHPDNAIPVQSWFDDVSDTELLDILPLLDKLAKADNVYTLLRNANVASPTTTISNGNLPSPLTMSFPIASLGGVDVVVSDVSTLHVSSEPRTTPR